MEYDYLITGGGAAGLSMAARLVAEPQLAQARILLVDEGPRKVQNDRTWCFWETEPGPFEEVVFHRWPQLWFHAPYGSHCLDISPYTYKMIRGADFYSYVNPRIDAAPQLERRQGRVTAVGQEGERAYALIDGQKVYARYVFNSVFLGHIDKSRVSYLDQHFRGWMVRTPQDAFDPHQATLMDYRTPQQGETRFLYVLPHTAREALVEVAIFSNQHLTAAGYDQIIANYLAEYWPAAQGYEIEQVEMGVIPMTDYAFPRQQGRVIHLGMAGGDTRASSGYTFWYLQQRIGGLINGLLQHNDPSLPDTLAQRRHRFYDSVLLRVLQHNYYPGDKLFHRLFARNPPARLLAFLNGETNLAQEVALMRTAPTLNFLRALWPLPPLTAAKKSNK